MNNDEEYVRSVWERAESFPHGYSDNDPKWRISLGGEMFTKASVPDPLARTEAEAWSAAAEFTRDWQEQVRQLREEISVQQSIFEHAECFAKLSGQRDSHGLIATAEKRVAPVKRTLARLEAELATLTAGMKPEAL